MPLILILIATLAWLAPAQAQVTYYWGDIECGLGPNLCALRDFSVLGAGLDANTLAKIQRSVDGDSWERDAGDNILSFAKNDGADEGLDLPGQSWLDDGTQLGTAYEVWVADCGIGINCTVTGAKVELELDPVEIARLDRLHDDYRERITWNLTLAAYSDSLLPNPDSIGYARQIIGSTNGQVNLSYGSITPSPAVLTIGDDSWRVINVQQLQHGSAAGTVEIRLGAPLDNGAPPTANAAAFPEGWDWQIGDLILRRRDTSDEQYFPHAVANGETTESVRTFIWDTVPAGALTAGATTLQALGVATTPYTLTDDAVLDLAQETRGAADRGMALGTSPTDQDALVLLDVPLQSTFDALEDRVDEVEALDTALRHSTVIVAGAAITATDRNTGYAITGATAPTQDGGDHEIHYTITPAGEDPINGVILLSALRAKTPVVRDG